MSYLLAAMVVSSSGAVTSSQYGPFVTKDTCQEAARSLVTGGIELTENEDMLTATIRIDTPKMVTVIFRYRLNCVRQ
jgi:hypothetical protein